MRNPGESRKILQYRKFPTLATPTRSRGQALFNHDMGRGSSPFRLEAIFSYEVDFEQKKPPESMGRSGDCV